MGGTVWCCAVVVPHYGAEVSDILSIYQWQLSREGAGPHSVCLTGECVVF